MGMESSKDWKSRLLKLPVNNGIITLQILGINNSPREEDLVEEWYETISIIGNRVNLSNIDPKG